MSFSLSLSHDTSFTHTTWKHPRLLNTCGLRWHYLTLKRLSRTTIIERLFFRASRSSTLRSDLRLQALFEATWFAVVAAVK